MINIIYKYTIRIPCSVCVYVCVPACPIYKDAITEKANKNPLRVADYNICICIRNKII